MSHQWDCPCETCQKRREDWAAWQPALAEVLDANDMEDLEGYLKEPTIDLAA